MRVSPLRAGGSASLPRPRPVSTPSEIGRESCESASSDISPPNIEAIDAGKNIKGIYHFANQGETTWFEFAKKIQATAGLTCEVNPIQTVDFPTPAKRPAYSVLDTSKIEHDLAIDIRHWEDALKDCMNHLSK